MTQLTSTALVRWQFGLSKALRAKEKHGGKTTQIYFIQKQSSKQHMNLSKIFGTKLAIKKKKI